MNVAARLISSSEEYDFLGTPDGYVMKGNTGTQDNGDDFRMDIQMSPSDLGLPNRTKTIVSLVTHYREASGQQAVELQVHLDQDLQASVAKNLTLGSNLQYNTGLLYDNGLVYPGGTIKTSSTFVNRTAREIAPQWRTTDALELIGYHVEFTVED
jgi:hypothetical protein